MNTTLAKYVMKNVVEPSDRRLPVIDLEDIIAHEARLVGELDTGEPVNRNRFRPGDVLFSKLRPYLRKVLFVASDCHGSGEFLCLRSSDHLDPRFLKFVTMSRPWIDHAVLSSYGSKMPRTSWDQMASFPVPSPPPYEQRRIADFLDDRVALIDQIIAARRAQRKQAEELFVAQLENMVKRQGSTRPLKGLLTDVTSGPRGWGDLVSDAGRPFVRIGNLRPLGVELNDEDLLRVQVPENAEAQRASLEPGDVLLSITAVFGEVAVWRSGDGAFSQHVARLRPQDTRDAEWIAWVLQSRSLHDQYSLVAYGGTKVGMGLDQVRNLRVPDINASKRNTMVNSLNRSWSRHDSAITVLDASILRMSEYKQSLVTAAVTGAFDVTTVSMRVPGE